MIIDFTTRQPMVEGEQATWSTPPPPPPVDKRVEVEQEKWDACQHRMMRIDDKQRTVKCGECGMWLDPVWCLHELFWYYERRVDSRLKAIEDFERREREAQERREKRKQQPRATRIRNRNNELERAAYNEYQAKLLMLKAGRQRERAAAIDEQLPEVDRLPVSALSLESQG